MPEKPLYGYARDAIIALSTSSGLRKLCAYETGGKSGARVKSTIRHPKFGVRGSKFRKPLALEEVGAEAGSILLADHEQEQLIFQYSIGDKPVPRDTVIAWGKGISGAVFQSGEARITNQVDQDATHLHSIDQTTGFVTRDKGDKGVRGVRG